MEGLLTYENGGVGSDAIGEPLGIDPEERRAYRRPLERAVSRLSDLHDRGERGFLELPERDPSDIVDWAADRRNGRWTDVVVLGIGGSSLGTRAILESARPDRLDGLDVHVAENVDPATFESLLGALALETTLFVVVTKSGTTVETMGKFAVVYDRIIDEVGRERAADHVVAVTDPNSGALRRLAEAEGFETFEIPPAVGGRFSVLSPVGLVPLALAGYPVGELLEGAELARNRAMGTDFDKNGVMKAVADLHLLGERGISAVVMMAYGDRLSTLVDWFRQLWAESLGKERNRDGEVVHAGTTPIKAVGTIDQHSQIQLYREGPADKVVVFVGTETYDGSVRIPDGPGLPEELDHLAGRDFGEVMRANLTGTRAALREAGRPTTTWRFRRIAPRAVGGFLMSWEIATATSAELLEVDAFNQPGVELGKNIAHGLLGDDDHAEHRVDDDSTPERDVLVPDSDDS